MSIVLIVLLVVSKLYYVNIFSFAAYNFTLSDLCLVICILQLLIQQNKDFKRNPRIVLELRTLLYIGIIAAILNCITTFFVGGNVFSSLMNIIKRWVSMLVIPLYVYKCVSPNKRRKALLFVIITIILYTLFNLNGIITENAVRFTAEGTANPNIIAGVFGLLFVYAIDAEFKSTLSKGLLMIISLFMVFACSSRGGVLAIIITLVLYMFLFMSNVPLGKKIGILLGSALIVALCLILGNSFLPDATERIIDSFIGGLNETASYQSRMKTLFVLLSLMFHHLGLLLFGTGFGNGNLYLITSRYGVMISTADSMYGDIFAWVGLIGIPLVVLFVVKVYKISSSICSKSKSSMIILVLYMLALGLSQSALFEPTVGCIFYVLWSLELCRSVDNKGDIIEG